MSNMVDILRRLKRFDPATGHFLDNKMIIDKGLPTVTTDNDAGMFIVYTGAAAVLGLCVICAVFLLLAKYTPWRLITSKCKHIKDTMIEVTLWKTVGGPTSTVLDSELSTCITPLQQPSQVHTPASPKTAMSLVHSRDDYGNLV